MPTQPPSAAPQEGARTAGPQRRSSISVRLLHSASSAGPVGSGHCQELAISSSAPAWERPRQNPTCSLLCDAKGSVQASSPQHRHGPSLLLGTWSGWQAPARRERYRKWRPPHCRTLFQSSSSVCDHAPAAAPLPSAGSTGSQGQRPPARAAHGPRRRSSASSAGGTARPVAIGPPRARPSARCGTSGRHCHCRRLAGRWLAVGVGIKNRSGCYTALLPPEGAPLVPRFTISSAVARNAGGLRLLEGSRTTSQSVPSQRRQASFRTCIGTAQHSSAPCCHVGTQQRWSAALHLILQG